MRNVEALLQARMNLGQCFATLRSRRQARGIANFLMDGEYMLRLRRPVGSECLQDPSLAGVTVGAVPHLTRTGMTYKDFRVPRKAANLSPEVWLFEMLAF
jgi:hypothetical protein